QSVPRLSTIVDQVISESDNFEPYVGSVGIIVVKGSKRIAYDSRRKLPGAITNHIIRVLDLPRLFLRSEFYRGVQSAKAVQIANTIITQLKEINIICENKNNGINKSWGVFLNQKLVGMLAVDKLTDQYVVQLEIYDHQDRR
ncbi:MAG TPA: hypothetical protein VK616_00665, partial [Flavitalea sp.]|nr:hypothetical protein [Flavitalea sp.]